MIPWPLEGTGIIKSCFWFDFSSTAVYGIGNEGDIAVIPPEPENEADVYFGDY